MDPLSTQLNAYYQWREHLLQQLTRYRGWLIDHNLLQDEVANKLAAAESALKYDRITMAFVGEISRGKTELINALLLGHVGASLLPTGPGATTTCPTEIYFNPLKPRELLRLLPIETSHLKDDISQLRNQPHAWHEIDLSDLDEEALQKAMLEVAKTKAVPWERAKELGFQVEQLEACQGADDHVLVPAWRYALVSLNHPLLAQGLVLIDTPGLNALGREPELTLSVLPEAQAVLFVLSASAGVSATDLYIWRQHLEGLSERPDAGVFAILNQIDSLWNELASEETNLEALAQSLQHSAKQLQLAPEKILHVSAREGMVAQMAGDLNRLNKSLLPELEEFLALDLVRRKAQRMQQEVLEDIHAMMHSSRSSLMRRRAVLASELKDLGAQTKERQQQLNDMLAENKRLQQLLDRDLAGVQKKQESLERKAQKLFDIMYQSKLEDHLLVAHEKIETSWTALGRNSALDQFFEKLEADITAANEEVINLQDFVDETFTSFETQNSFAPMHHSRFIGREYLSWVKSLATSSGRFGNGFKQMLTEQKSTSQRLAATSLRKGTEIYTQYLRNFNDWIKEALLPLTQYCQEQLNLLQEKQQKLEAVDTCGDEKMQIEKLEDLLTDIDEQFHKLDDMVKVIRQPPSLQ